jgi:hypothetical protein
MSITIICRVAPISNIFSIKKLDVETGNGGAGVGVPASPGVLWVTV